MYYRSSNRIRARAKLPALTERTFEIRVVKLEHRIQRDFIHRGSHAQQQMDMRLVEDSSTHREQIDETFAADQFFAVIALLTGFLVGGDWEGATMPTSAGLRRRRSTGWHAA